MMHLMHGMIVTDCIKREFWSGRNERTNNLNKKFINMKLLIAVMLLLPLCAQSQCKFLINKQDEFTGVYEKQLELAAIGKGVYGSMGRNDSLTYICVAADVGCTAPKQSKFYIKFSDDSVLELTNINKVSCSTMPIFIAYIDEDIEAFRAKTVAKGRLSGTERSVDFDFKDALYFQKGLKCVE